MAQTPPLADLGEVAQRPARYRGKYIRIEGRAGPVRIVHRSGTVRSSLTLHEAAGAMLGVELKHIKLDSGGLVEGAYAELIGTFGSEDDNSAAETLRPDRRNLTEDSRTSWLDWLTLELLPVATPTSHMLRGRWSWVAGSDGAVNPLKYGTWASTRERGLS